MSIFAVECPASLSANSLNPSESEKNTLDILCTLYDLYDAKRWVVRFIEKHKDSELNEMILHFKEISEKLSELIKHYSFLMNEVMKEKTLDGQCSLEADLDIWP